MQDLVEIAVTEFIVIVAAIIFTTISTFILVVSIPTLTTSTNYSVTNLSF